MPNIEDMQQDPEPMDETDPRVLEEMFEQAKALGDKPEDLSGASEEFRKKYAEWLASK